jgi:alkylation response protein AidB-like acyl-CoA dehydrogenase
MHFELTTEQAMFRDSVAGFARRELADGAVERAQSDLAAFDISRKLSEQGLLGITIPEKDGGIGGTLMDAVIAIEQVALACPKSADLVQAGNFGPIRTFAEYASPAQKETYLPQLLKGSQIISLGMSEPQAGSAVTELETRATPDGSGFRVNGTKVFSTNSSLADVFLVYVRFGPGLNGIGSVLIEKGAEGFTLGKEARFMNGEVWRQLYFQDVFIPPDNVLLPAGGFKKQISGFNVERLGNAARSLALGRLAFNVARDHVRTRRQFGKSLMEFQGLQWQFAESAMELEAAQMMLYRAALSDVGGLPDPHLTAMAKCICNRAGHAVADRAMQAMGALGFSEDCIVQYCVRRTRGWMIAGGSVEMMLNRIAEGVFETRFSQKPQPALRAAQ